jgi:hypothetical protein
MKKVTFELKKIAINHSMTTKNCPSSELLLLAFPRVSIAPRKKEVGNFIEFGKAGFTTNLKSCIEVVLKEIIV